MKFLSLKYFLLIFFCIIFALAVGVSARALLELKNKKEWLATDSLINGYPQVLEENQLSTLNIFFPSFIDASKMTVDKDEERFIRLKEEYIANKVSFIEVDLRKMILRLYESGKVIKEMPVLTKGREGSWWETPTGIYKTLAKTVNHFSSIGNVWMPYSIQFYGNFFIHGWPYYPDGTPVAASYSGGCVRLSTEDAKNVFQFATIGMPILILEEPEVMESPSSVLIKKISSDLNAPVISAKAALVADLDSGLILLDKNSGQALPIASLVKLMTGVVASEIIYLERTTEVGFSNSLSFLPNKSYTAFDLLYPLLMQSSNEAASFIASFLGEKEFVKKMNEKAESLGMKNTVFADVSGKSSENVSTAKDLAKLAKYILEKRRFLYDISRGKNYLTFGPLNFGNLDNYNEFYNHPNLIGVKNGQTIAAKQTMLTVWNFRLGQNGPNKRIVIIVLGSEDRKTDTEVLLNWLRDNFDLQ